MIPQETVKMKSIRELKNMAVDLPDPVKTLILSEPDEIPQDELVAKFIMWRKLIRMGVK